MHRQLANGKRNFLRFCFSKAGRRVWLVSMFPQLFLQRKLETQAVSNRQLIDQLPLYRSALLLTSNDIHCFCLTNTLKRKIDSNHFLFFIVTPVTCLQSQRSILASLAAAALNPQLKTRSLIVFFSNSGQLICLMKCVPCFPILVSSIRKYNTFFFISLSIRSLYLPTLHLLKGHHKDGCCNLR